jgi:hypothetical protein
LRSVALGKSLEESCGEQLMTEYLVQKFDFQIPETAFEKFVFYSVLKLLK